MLGLPIPEFVIFVSVVMIYLTAAIIDTFQLLSGGDKCSRFLRPLVGLAIVLEAVILVLRGISINAFPLTELFESMVLLTIIFGLAYLFISISIKQIWFGSAMVWVILLVFLLAISVAAPASITSLCIFTAAPSQNQLTNRKLRPERLVVGTEIVVSVAYRKVGPVCVLCQMPSMTTG